MELLNIDINLEHMTEEEIDHVAFSMFTTQMLQRLYFKREHNGKGGWWDEKSCTINHLIELFHRSVEKGDPLDIANYAMMIHQRGSSVFKLSADNPLSSYYILEPHVALHVAHAMMKFIYPASAPTIPDVIQWEYEELRIAEFLSGTRYGTINPNAAAEDGWKPNEFPMMVPQNGDMVDILVKNPSELHIFEIKRAVHVAGEWFREVPRNGGKALIALDGDLGIYHWRPSK